MVTTKQKILICAVDLFASKGYTETSVRDIAAVVGIKASSLYNHFSSKEDILMFMLDDFANSTRIMAHNPELPAMIRKNSSAQGIMECMHIDFSVLTDKYYSKALHVIFHEQHRNKDVRKLVLEVMLNVESYVERFFTELKKLKIIRRDADSDFWKKTASSFIYALPNRMMLGIGQGSESYKGMDLAELLRCMFDMVLKIYKV